MDVAEQQVQAAINAGSNLLPSDPPMPPIYSKVNPADAPIPHAGHHLALAARHPPERPGGKPPAPKLSQVNGVGL